jgi:xanthine/uracil permease
MVTEAVEAQHKRWMKLDPSHQYMSWAAGGTIFCGLCAALMALFVSEADVVSVPILMSVIGGGILMMFGIFLYAVLFLTVIWPHRYQRHTKQ